MFYLLFVIVVNVQRVDASVWQMKFDKIKGERVGTQGFVAPEILCGFNYCELCDIFSCGIVLINMTTGKMPFPKPKGVGEMIFNPRTQMKHFQPSKNYDLFASNKKAFWNKFDNNIAANKRLTSLVKKMLEFDPKKRIGIEKIETNKWYNGKHYKRGDIKTQVQFLQKSAVEFCVYTQLFDVLCM